MNIGSINCINNKSYFYRRKCNTQNYNSSSSPKTYLPYSYGILPKSNVSFKGGLIDAVPEISMAKGYLAGLGAIRMAALGRKADIEGVAASLSVSRIISRKGQKFKVMNWDGAPNGIHYIFEEGKPTLRELIDKTEHKHYVFDESGILIKYSEKDASGKPFVNVDFDTEGNATHFEMFLSQAVLKLKLSAHSFV